MYSLKTPSPSQFTALSRAFTDQLAESKIEMSDRRQVTAYILGRIVGGSLPVFDMAGPNIAANTFREQFLPTVKAYLGRVAEAVTIDQDLAIIGTYFEWVRRSSAAFPQRPALTNDRLEAHAYGNEQQTAVLSQVAKKYCDLNLNWTLASLLTETGA